MIKFTCPCGKKLQADDSFSGLQSQCPACHSFVVVPPVAYGGDVVIPPGPLDPGVVTPSSPETPVRIVPAREAGLRRTAEALGNAGIALGAVATFQAANGHGWAAMLPYAALGCLLGLLGLRCLADRRDPGSPAVAIGLCCFAVILGLSLEFSPAGGVKSSARVREFFKKAM